MRDELRGRGELARFLRCNSRGGKVGPAVEVYSSAVMEKAAGGGSFSWVMSTGDLDRDMERIDPAGWLLDTYRTNPVVLWSHDRTIPAIGYAKDVEADTSLHGEIVFNPKEVDEFGWGIGERVRCGALRTGSVGFLVCEVEFIDHAAHPEEKAELIYRKQELLEYSICNVPANPFALCAEEAAVSGAACAAGKETGAGMMYEVIRRNLRHE